ncbi:MAG: hypothetical protein ABII12_16585 [Planctomycetota bacterium]
MLSTVAFAFNRVATAPLADLATGSGGICTNIRIHNTFRNAIFAVALYDRSAIERIRVGRPGSEVRKCGW